MRAAGQCLPLPVSELCACVAVTQVVAALLRALLPLADRLAALQLVVAETPPLVHGRLSGWAFEAIVLPMHADMSVRDMCVCLYVCMCGG